MGEGGLGAEGEEGEGGEGGEGEGYGDDCPMLYLSKAPTVSLAESDSGSV